MHARFLHLLMLRVLRANFKFHSVFPRALVLGQFTMNDNNKMLHASTPASCIVFSLICPVFTQSNCSWFLALSGWRFYLWGFRTKLKAIGFIGKLYRHSWPFFCLYSIFLSLPCWGLFERKSESKVTQLCPTLCDPMDCSPPGSSIHGIFQARILEWVAISFSRRSSQPRDWTLVSLIIGRRFTVWATRED